MGHVNEAIELGRGRSEVWDFVTDPDHFPDYVSGYQSGRVTTPEATGEGSGFEWRAALGPLTLDASESVVEWLPDERVRYEGTLAGSSFRSAMELSPAGHGTRLEVDIDYELPRGLGVLGPLMQRLVRSDVRRSLERVAEELGDEPASVQALYRRRAGSYDVATGLYRLAFPLRRYRRMAVDALGVKPGDSVVEIGCGTGANFELIQQRIGPRGRLVGVDLTDAMLEQARRRIARHGWDNVELVQSDAARFEFPHATNGILSTLALTLSPDYDAVIERGARALASGGRWVVLDLKNPGWPRRLMDLALTVMRPYGVTLERGERHPWESLERHMPQASTRELYLGIAYLAVGENSP
jgi:demethylmenaquinone methyltransferase/2-methoxy-6-polyprenyl-1,4-benzoquinol methylase